MDKCKECGREMNPVERLLSVEYNVCGKCCRKKHREVINNRRLIK